MKTNNKPIIDQKIEELAEEEDITVAHAARTFLKRSDDAIDLDNLPAQQHKWVDRGEVINCEGGDHPFHQVFKRR